MQYAKLTLLALVISAAIAAATASPLLRGDVFPSSEGIDPRGTGASASSKALTASDRCILVINTCPADNPRCGKEPLQITVSCTDPSCVPGSCITATDTATIKQIIDTEDEDDPEDSCMIRRFECTKGALYSCFKRWRSKSIKCSDSACSGDGCMKSDIFFATYTLQPWDVSPLQGPFPRTETMCVIERSSCPPGDSSCLSAVSLEQISCDDRACANNTCTRTSVLVDQNDIIVSASASSTSRQTEKTEEEKKTEEGQKHMEEKQREAEKKEGEQERQGGDAEDTKDIKQEIRTQPALGCFNVAGQWTTDRTHCATNQQPYVQPAQTGNEQKGNTNPENPVERQQVERQIEEKFVPDTRRTAVAQNLLSSTTEAVGRISRMLENPSLPPQTRTLLEGKQQELQAAQRAVTQDQSVRELQELADTVSDDLASVQETVRQLSSAPVSPPLTITARLDRIFAQIPAVFGVLLNEGVPVDSMTIEAYLSAQSVYDDVGPVCLSQPDTCADLAKAIDALQPVFAGLMLSLESAGRQDLEGQIDELLK